jgi:hypothetical protein
MTPLNYQTEVFASCSPEDVDFMAFVEATSLIGGRNAVEEFLACSLWPLGEQFGFEVDRKESPLSKVIVLMRHITASIGSSCYVAQNSFQELALAKPMKPSKKFVVKDGAAGKKTLPTSMGGSGMTRGSKHARKLFGSDLSASDDETAPPERPSKGAPLVKDVPKSYSLKGIFG